VKLMALCVLAAALLVPAAGRAAEPENDLHDALDAQASAPATPPSLPDEASARAKVVQDTVAHGKKGAEERNAHAQDDAAAHGDAAADAARKDASARAVDGAAASAAKSANADSHAAAGQARAAEAHGAKVPGGKPGHPAGPPPHGH
jgi:hypothetical protein